MAWLSYLPLWGIHALGSVFGWLAYFLSASYRQRLRTQAARAGLSAGQIRRAVAEAGRMSAEVPWLWCRDASRPLRPLVQWDGAELIDRALDAGRGLVLLTPHLGSFEVSARAYAERWGQRQPITVLYRPARQAWLAAWQTEARTRPGMDAAPASLAGVRQMLRALRNGQTLGLLPDQVPPDGLGVWAPFFGQPAYTMTMAARLIHQTGATALLAWCERLPGGRGFVVRLRPMPPLPSGDDVADATAINRNMESLVRECPTQYLWGYARYKQPRPMKAPA